MKKYEFTGETKTYLGRTLHRIRAVVAFGVIHAKDLGGWIENEQNLPQGDSAWVYGDAKVYGNAKVWDNAEVYGDAEVCGDAKVCSNAKVYGNARVFGNADVCGDAKVYGNARVFDNAEVFGYAKVFGNADVFGYAKVYENAKVYGNAKVCSNAEVCGDASIFKTEHILVIGPVGSRKNSFTTFFRNKDDEIFIKSGCFLGNIDRFLQKVSETHGNDKHALVYRSAVHLAELQIDAMPF